jgi:hypothetical protein
MDRRGVAAAVEVLIISNMSGEGTMEEFTESRQPLAREENVGCRPSDRSVGRWRVALFTMLAGLSGHGLTLAADTGATESAVTDEVGLADIVVTAQKYKSTILDTSISMSALSGDQMIAAGIRRARHETEIYAP